MTKATRIVVLMALMLDGADDGLISASLAASSSGTPTAKLAEDQIKASNAYPIRLTSCI